MGARRFVAAVVPIFLGTMLSLSFARKGWQLAICMCMLRFLGPEALVLVTVTTAQARVLCASAPKALARSAVEAPEGPARSAATCPPYLHARSPV